ncbi:MAG TPA: MgtC/SapB family protein [Candidatus Pelethomonas intestinigallinarum]|nr:MgtC/SapB family protein [Candidatus Pelethomonas intestinigallinarum]
MFLELEEAIDLLQEFNGVSVTVRVLLAAVLGGLVGSERGRRGRAAGMRTHVLVCLGAAMTSMVGLYSAEVLGFTNDPLRVSAQVISGIGFLGAGTIMTRNHAQITGLTTAAGLWATASLGLCIGTGFYGGVLAAFLVILVTMVALPSLERKRRTRREYVCYYLELDNVKRTDDFYEQITPVPEAEVQIVPARSGLPGNVGLELTIPADWEESQQMLEDLRKQDYILLLIPVAKY